MSRLAEIAALRDGWWGPGSRAVDPSAVRSVEALAPELARSDVHIAIASSVDGAIVLEWRRGDEACTAHIEPGDQMFLCIDNVATDDIDEFEGGFDTARLLRFVHTGALA